MNAFVTTVMINNLAADYQIFRIGKKYKAMLIQTYLGNCIPCQLDFWKEKGVWKTYHPLTQFVICQFGNYIDNYVSVQQAENFGNPTAA